MSSPPSLSDGPGAVLLFLLLPQVEWLRARVVQVPVRLVFESSLELMESTQVGGFKMAPGGKSKGPPPAVAKVLSLFGSGGREEDKMVGYLSFLKIGPKLLKFLPGERACVAAGVGVPRWGLQRDLPCCPPCPHRTPPFTEILLPCCPSRPEGKGPSHLADHVLILESGRPGQRRLDVPLPRPGVLWVAALGRRRQGMIWGSG